MMWALGAFAAGMALLLAEFVVPGLICGIVGVVLIATSGVLAFKAYPEYLLLIIVVELLGVAGTVIAGMYILARTRAAKGIILATSQQADAGWVAAETDHDLLGKVGTVHTALRPAGTIMVEGKRVDAVSSGDFIDKDAAVRVIETHGARVVVEKTS